MLRRLNNRGFLGIVALIITIMIIGYLVINRLTASEAAQDVQQTTTELIDDAKNTVDKANDAANKADVLLEGTNELIN